MYFCGNKSGQKEILFEQYGVEFSWHKGSLFSVYLLNAISQTFIMVEADRILSFHKMLKFSSCWVDLTEMIRQA